MYMLGWWELETEGQNDGRPALPQTAVSLGCGFGATVVRLSSCKDMPSVDGPSHVLCQRRRTHLRRFANDTTCQCKSHANIVPGIWVEEATDTSSIFLHGLAVPVQAAVRVVWNFKQTTLAWPKG